MASKKIELVNFELHNYCAKQDEKNGFVCDDMQCDSCAYHKKYLLDVSGRGIDVVRLAEEYEICRYVSGDRYFMRLKSKRQRSHKWLLVLLLLFSLMFTAGYLATVKYLVQ